MYSRAVPTCPLFFFIIIEIEFFLMPVYLIVYNSSTYNIFQNVFYVTMKKAFNFDYITCVMHKRFMKCTRH
ncbi:hypothetical protein FWK35_00036989 [Aphis craccivora]|uniref:Uncharacterized protein n=1 Tax=Aphis craccivora TaxID=307492 RepID=A0A6G0Y5D8_APHCR|nr:hypothetical protein FWK35_00036989 [Aphis craccivora]